MNIGALTVAYALWLERRDALVDEANAGNIIEDETWPGVTGVKFYVRHGDASALRIEHHPEQEHPYLMTLFLSDGAHQMLADAFEDCFDGIPTLIPQYQ